MLRVGVGLCQLLRIGGLKEGLVEKLHGVFSVDRDRPVANGKVHYTTEAGGHLYYSTTVGRRGWTLSTGGLTSASAFFNTIGAVQLGEEAWMCGRKFTGVSGLTAQPLAVVELTAAEVAEDGGLFKLAAVMRAPRSRSVGLGAEATEAEVAAAEAEADAALEAAGMAENFSDDKKRGRALVSLFRTCDLDGSGAITREEVAAVVAAEKERTGESVGFTVGEVMRDDKDADGKITLSEFLGGCSRFLDAEKAEKKAEELRLSSEAAKAMHAAQVGVEGEEDERARWDEDEGEEVEVTQVAEANVDN